MRGNDYDEQAYVDKDLQFFVQEGADGVTLTLDRHEDTGAFIEELYLISESDIVVNGNEGNNRIEVIDPNAGQKIDGIDIVGDAETDGVFLDSSGDLAFFGLGNQGNAVTDYGVIDAFDQASYQFYGRGGNDELVLRPDSEEVHYLFGGSGNDHLFGAQAPTWLDGGSGNDTIYSVGGSDRVLAGSGDDEVILATYDDNADGGDGRVSILLGGGRDTLTPTALDSGDGIDIDAFVGDYTRGEDLIDLGMLRDAEGGSVDLSDLIADPDTNTNTISLDDFFANILADEDPTEEVNVDAEGAIRLLGANVERLVNSDIGKAMDIAWKDEWEDILGANPLSEAG